MKSSKQFLAAAIYGLLLSFCVNASENEQAKTKAESTPSKMPFSAPLERLAQSATSDDSIWIDVENTKHLVLFHGGRGRKERGNLLILHAQGENPEHSRIVKPLTKQLTKLGWNIFIPSIASENFPRASHSQNSNTDEPEIDTAKLNPSGNSAADSESATEDSSADVPVGGKNIDQTSFYFKNSDKYQDYYLNLCKAVFEQTEIAKQPTLIIAIQDSAYWSLRCLEQDNMRLPIVFLQPQLPLGIKDDLDSRFSLQKTSVFSFISSSNKKAPFSKAFRKRLWRAKYQRFNVGMLPSAKLEVEDSNIARTITGWFEKQRQKK